MVDALVAKTCTPCRGGIPPLTPQEAEHFHVHVPQWEVRDEARRIERTFRFRNFGEALALVQQVGELAEAEGHHPDISFWLGLRHGGDANEEDQRTARKRFHHGGQDRPALGASRLTIDRSVSTARKESDRAECERKLDQALELTFPASDPIAVGCPTSTELAMRPALSERVLPTRKHRNVKERQR